MYLRTPAHSPLAAEVERADSREHVLAGLFTVAGRESITEVRVEASVLYRTSNGRAS